MAAARGHGTRVDQTVLGWVVRDRAGRHGRAEGILGALRGRGRGGGGAAAYPQASA
jgi:hypothetical protein